MTEPSNEKAESGNTDAEKNTARDMAGDLRLFVYTFVFVTVVSWFSGSIQVADLCAQMRVQTAVAQIFVLTLMAILAKFKLFSRADLIALVLTLLTLAFNIYSIFTNCFDLSVSALNEPPSQTAQTIRIVDFNLHNKNKDYDLFKAYIKEKNPDVICLQEYTNGWADALIDLKKTYPYVVSATRWDPFGIVIYSRYPFVTSKILDLGPAHVPTAYCSVKAEDMDIHFLSTHPYPPLNDPAYHERNEQYAELAEFVRDLKGQHVVLCGDLNCVPWSGSFSEFMARSGLRDTRLGFGLGATWPAGVWSFRIPIDHVLITPELRATKRTIGRHLGSDHLPVYVELQASTPGPNQSKKPSENR